MPCRNEAADFEQYEADQKVVKLKEEISTLSAMLCSALTEIEVTDPNLKEFLATRNVKESGVSNKEIRDWWKEHKKKDKVRKSREKSKTAFDLLKGESPSWEDARDVVLGFIAKASKDVK